MTKNLTAPPRARATVVVHDSANFGVGRRQTVSARVETTIPGGIIVERPHYFTYNGTIDGGHVVVGYAP